jgi:hypothetical protein
MGLPAQKTLRVKYIAPEIHALTFASMWVLYATFSQPLFNGPAAIPFVVLLIADLPISVIAFAVMFTSISMGPIAAVAWGVLGTLWWFVIGIAVDRRLRSYREDRAGPPKLTAPTIAASPAIPDSRKELLIAASVVLVMVVVSVAAKWNHTPGHFEKGTIRSFSFAPDGRSLLLVRSLVNSSHLEKVDLNSGTSAPLGDALPCDASTPTYSPDESRIAFSCESKASGLSHIFTMDADGRNLNPLFSSDSDSYDFAPHFTPDGKEIHFGRVRSFTNDPSRGAALPRKWDLYSSNLEGGNQRKLTDRDLQDFDVSYSADGTQFATSGGFVSGARLNLYSLDDPGKTANAIPLAIPNGAQPPVIDEVKLASDGRSIYFMAATDGKKGFDYDIYRADITGRDVEKFTTANGYATSLAVSADGKTVAFLKWTSRWGSLPNLSRLYVLDLATKQVKPLDVTGTANR